MMEFPAEFWENGMKAREAKWPIEAALQKKAALQNLVWHVYKSCIWQLDSQLKKLRQTMQIRTGIAHI